MEYFLVFVAGMAASVLTLRWTINRAINRTLDRWTQEDEVAPDAANMELRVEFDQDIYFCYNVIDGAFVCQGKNLTEIQSNFCRRFPDINAVIVDGDDDCAKHLKTEMTKINESDTRQTS